MSARPFDSSTSELQGLPEDLQNLNEKLKTEMHRLQMLLDVISLVASDLDLSRVFPRISARIRRVLHQEYASFSLHDATTDLLVCQALDFPLSKGHVSQSHISASDSPQARVLHEGNSRIFLKEELSGFEGDSAKSFL
jgi:hypothetical protein